MCAAWDSAKGEDIAVNSKVAGHTGKQRLGPSQFREFAGEPRLTNRSPEHYQRFRCGIRRAVGKGGVQKPSNCQRKSER